MQRLLLLDSNKKKDSELGSKLKGMGYPFSSILVSGQGNFDNTSIKKTDIIFYSYDEAEFDTVFNDLSDLLVGSPVIFVVEKCSTALFDSMARFSNSLYLKEPFEKNELDFIVRMASSEGSLHEGKAVCEFESMGHKVEEQKKLVNVAFDQAPVLMIIIIVNNQTFIT
ncbi:hypothetical protein [uncultured Methanolobus sp.]|uniref:hypothetical protein n=1 Tax=uncultured Methanolobus sp. TaxID=218300 RepID=UPI0029C920DF|nr:hypothetical protein [uncultured Methanolobus sp.]